MHRVVVLGAAGKMGRRVVELMRTAPELQLVGALVHAAHPALGQDIGTIAGGGPLGVTLHADLGACLPHADVVIDFSVPEATLAALPLVAEAHKAMVIGTTGFTEAQRQIIHRIGTEMRCFIAPNMSLGVSILVQVLRQVATTLGADYDVEIIEAHHRTKVDAPSGTALHIAATIAESLGRNLDDVAVYGRHGMVGKRPETAIGIQAIRAGDIIGEHTIIFGGIGERLEFIHRSQSRDNFARGALRAAGWILRQPPGLYTMQDLVRLA